MKRLLVVALVAAVVACATGMTQEQKLDQSYKTSLAAVKGASVLLNRGAISSGEAARVELLGRTAKAGLDADKEQLAKCRATPGAVCDDTAASVNLYSGVLNQLEIYLKAKEVK